MVRALLPLLLVAIVTTASAPPLLVSAAISLTDALQTVEKVYVAGGGGRVQFNFAGSNVLARQIVNGAPVDIFISADELQMDYAGREGAIDTRSRRDLLSNRLAVVTSRGRTTTVRDHRGLGQEAVRRIAIADPAAVPAGVYAKQYLETMGLWQQLQPKLLPLANVRAALAATESGGADAAIVYESDAATSNEVDLAFVVSGANAPRIIYPAAIVTRSSNKEEAARFLEFLTTSEATKIFTRYKFARPSPPESKGPNGHLSR